MVYLFIYYCFYSSFLAVASRIRHWRWVTPFVERRAASYAVVPASAHILVNLTCIDGIQYTWTDFSLVNVIMSMKHSFLIVCIIVPILFVIIGERVEVFLEKNDYEFPEWWRSVFDRIPFLIKLILFFGVIIGPFYILFILISEYGYLH